LELKSGQKQDSGFPIYWLVALQDGKGTVPLIERLSHRIAPPPSQATPRLFPGFPWTIFKFRYKKISETAQE